ncbi:MAG: SusC/RagA family TonB-linked outer membrane protein [Gemmatimonadaceae bacterium]
MSSFRPSNVVARLRLVLVTAVAVCAPALALAQSGTITGRVVASNNGQPLPESRVFVVGTQAVATTNADGRYTLRTAPGTFEVRVIRVGYQEQKKPVTVAASGTATIDFSMVQAVVKLTEIVTTATGEQRRVELGHSVQTLGDIANNVETRPVTNLTDLMVAKAPGVIVLPGNMTGSAPSIRIRGIKSVSLSSEPIYVIDGIRMNAQAINVGNGTGGTQISLLNTLNPEEISDIEIVKGPSAATLYGTDAANGVVVITTKKGQAGATRWSWHTDGGLVKDRNAYPTQYALWGHAPATPTVPRRCILVTVADGTCIADSTTSYNLLADPEVSVKATGNRQQFGGQVSGGSDLVRYFISGDAEHERGPTELPQFYRNYFDSLKTTIREEWLHPEDFKRNSLRANLNTVLTPKLDLSINSAYTKTSQRLPQVDNNTFSYLYQAFNNPGFKPSAACRANSVNCLGYTNVGQLGETLGGYVQFTPAQLFQFFSNTDIDRFINSASAQWRPVSWIQTDGTAGIDYAQREGLRICRLAECPASGTTRLGAVIDNRASDRNLSMKLNSTATWQPRTTVNLKTTIGADYVNQQTEFTNATGQTLPPGAQGVGQAAIQTASSSLPRADKTLGYYAQEQIALRDRLFLTLAARSDQNSAFGTNFQRVLYPKASASYIISDEAWFPKVSAVNSLRLRGAYGASGVQPGSTTALQTFATTNVSLPTAITNVVGVDAPGLVASALGNPLLKPERSTEREFGFETKLFGSRLNFDYTYYNNVTKDALVDLPIAASSGAAGSPNLRITTNIGSVRNSGHEATVTATILDRRNFSWDVTIAGSHNTNVVESLGFDAAGNPNPAIGTGANRDSVGFPIRGFFARKYTYSDANGNGIIEASEVSTPGAFEYVGYSVPRDVVTFQNGFDLFDRKLHLGFLLDYKGGFSLYNNTTSFYCQQSNQCYDETHKEASLDAQARLIALRYKTPSSPFGYYENGQFWRLREVGATLTVPKSVSNALRSRDASLTFTARNLHVWTAYTGTDPEANYATGNVQTDFSTTAPPSYFTLRLNLHY